MISDTVVLEMHNITKDFPGVRALNNCCFSLRKSEIHALIGENGAGKSTLVKIMTGIYSDYQGEYTLFGRKVHFTTIKEAQDAGISVVHQELNMMNDLTVAQNIFIGRESTGFFCSDKDINKKTETIIKQFDIDVKPTDLLKNLSISKAQMVEIARAMSYGTTKVLILDEPTAALSKSESKDLFNKMRALREQGIAIIFISHRLNEIKEIADRVTVMRDGSYIKTLDAASCGINDIIKLMIGREVSHDIKKASCVPADSPVIFEAKNLVSSKVKDVSFYLRKGEILGFAGLVGAGRTETMRLICGADPKTSGEIFIKGEKKNIRHPKDAILYGIGYLSEDRKRYGLVLRLPVTQNTVLSSYSRLKKLGIFYDGRACEKQTTRYVQELRIKTPDNRQLVNNLSGGNQQKVVIAKWLLRDVDVLIFDEPTRGIDVGARAEIYNLMNDLVSQGKSIIMISSDLPEILKMSDRIVVMCEGCKTGELDIAAATQENIMVLATKHKGDE
jgi:ribose transport system ATP-binding protein